MGFMTSINSLSDIVGKATSWLLPLLAAVVGYDVIARYLFGHPTLWAYDTAYMLYATNFLFGGAYVHSKMSHIRVDVFLGLLSEYSRSILELIFYIICFFPLMVVCLYSTALYAIDSWTFLERSIATPLCIPIYPIKTIPVIAFFLLLIQGIADFVERVTFLRKAVTS